MNILAFPSRISERYSSLARQVYLSVINRSWAKYQLIRVLALISLLIRVKLIMTKLMKLLLAVKHNDDVTTWKALTILLAFRRLHCVKIARIWSYSGSYFLAFRLNTERYGVLSVFSSKAGKTDQNNSEYGHFSRSAFQSIYCTNNEQRTSSLLEYY